MSGLILLTAGEGPVLDPGLDAVLTVASTDGPHQFTTLEKVGIAAVVILVIWVLWRIIVDVFKAGSLSGVRKKVYKLFLEAEHAYTESGAGEEKMDWVVSQAWNFFPPILKIFLSESLLKLIIQKWFDSVKDLLDDGKINNSSKEGGENLEEEETPKESFEEDP